MVPRIEEARQLNVEQVDEDVTDCVDVKREIKGTSSQGRREEKRPDGPDLPSR